MANQTERTELHKTIWKIANDLRGSVDGWEFKAYVLGSIFYRFISENICDYIHQLMKEAGQPDFDYATISDEMGERIRQKMVEEKGYFILPSQLFQNVVKTADKDEDLNEKLTGIFRSIEASAQGTESEDDLRGLFSDFSVDSAALGSTVIKRNQLLAKVLKTVASMDLGSKYNDTDNDTFGDTYEFLMQMYASEAGKSGGEFFTPQQVSELLARLASYNNPNIQKVYDEYYKPVTEYKNMKEPFDYLHATDYGYVDLTRHDFYGKRIFSADEYVMYCGTHSDHILIPEPYKTKFFEGLRSVVLAGGDKVEFRDTYVLYLTKKPA